MEKLKRLILFVDSVYKTLNSLKEYLAEFWGYYQSNPKLQKMLEEIPP